MPAEVEIGFMKTEPPQPYSQEMIWGTFGQGSSRGLCQSRRWLEPKASGLGKVRTAGCPLVGQKHDCALQRPSYTLLPWAKDQKVGKIHVLG